MKTHNFFQESLPRKVSKRSFDIKKKTFSGPIQFILHTEVVPLLKKPQWVFLALRTEANTSKMGSKALHNSVRPCLSSIIHRSTLYTVTETQCSSCISLLLLFGRWVVSDSVTPWTIAHQAPLSMGFPRQTYWKWVAISFSRSSVSSDGALISCIAGRFFTTKPLKLTRFHSALRSWAYWFIT